MRRVITAAVYLSLLWFLALVPTVSNLVLVGLPVVVTNETPTHQSLFSAKPRKSFIVHFKTTCTFSFASFQYPIYMSI